MVSDKDIIEASAKLVEALQVMHEDPKWISAWTFLYNHDYVYTGSKYGVELEKLQALLAEHATQNAPCSL